MKTLVLYESKFGNTKRVAETIGMQLLAEGPVRVTTIESYKPQFLGGVDLVLVGGATQGHGATPEMRQFLATLRFQAAGMRAIAFDTRLNGPIWLWGSAARDIENELREAGFDVIGPAASFLVTLARHPELHDGELQRAAAWARWSADEVREEQLLAV
ncbi:MAG: flavodoxin family protein [Candidatus Dormibacterales bacterium]